MIKCIHFIPFDGVGGVETAARSCIMKGASAKEVDLRLMCLVGWASFKEKSDQDKNKIFAFTIVRSLARLRTHLNNPIAHFWALLTLIRQKPDVLICSLWRTLFAGILYKLLCPKVKLVCFLHSAGTTNLIDKLINHCGMAVADAIWADSKTTITIRVPSRLTSRKPLRVISFILSRIIPPHSLPKNNPFFVYWGRLNYWKGIDRALQVFANIHQTIPTASFFIYGSDDGEEANLKKLVRKLGISNSVHFLGLQEFKEIKNSSHNYSFYLQLSRKEGMALSVIEAMQLGLVPIVAPVGEIKNYCQDSKNSLIIKDIDTATQRILSLLKDTENYCELQKNALSSWRNPLLYADDIAIAIQDVVR
ncbi:MAG: glycosyltransferase family 4 protein [Candidatus Electrothrix sp. GW3-4]|uniref:glycosyltransferase family 4 protein n=1 Tax=Candidatus Electrothrix sp. GW3-4 TaxID=3126740 RepID=UPI0030CFC62C